MNSGFTRIQDDPNTANGVRKRSTSEQMVACSIEKTEKVPT